MRLLLLGGTRFLGRHIAQIALEHGHAVTLFTRGEATNPFGEQVTLLSGNRDPEVGAGLGALVDDTTWDAVIDLSGYLPRAVGASARLLQGRASRYVFVSSISAYADFSQPGMNEDAPLAELSDAASEDINKDYGALKAGCERAVLDLWKEGALIVRPGLIVGPWDHTDRFNYWAARFAAPQLLGGREPSVLLPGPPERPVQYIDARDLAAWILHGMTTGLHGCFHATSPADHWRMADLAEAGCVIAAQQGKQPVPVWVSDQALIDAKVAPWTGLPLWIPQSDTSMAGFMRVDTSRAQAAGLRVRPLSETLWDTAQWLASDAPPSPQRWQQVLTAQTEAALVASAGKTSPQHI